MGRARDLFFKKTDEQIRNITTHYTVSMELLTFDGLAEAELRAAAEVDSHGNDFRRKNVHFDVPEVRSSSR